MNMAIFMHGKDNEALGDIILEEFRKCQFRSDGVTDAMRAYMELTGSGLKEASVYVKARLAEAGLAEAGY
jgi:hypothetical protein